MNCESIINIDHVLEMLLKRGGKLSNATCLSNHDDTHSNSWLSNFSTSSVICCFLETVFKSSHDINFAVQQHFFKVPKCWWSWVKSFSDCNQDYYRFLRKLRQTAEHYSLASASLCALIEWKISCNKISAIKFSRKIKWTCLL